MGNKMLIDAAHPEETRVVVVRGDKVEEFDYEAAAKKQLRGNIYLARVTRVEPSLQAAFVDYGGNRHGFLAFNEIHPDYYQIPVADRQQEIEAEREEESRARASEDDADMDDGTVIVRPDNAEDDDGEEVGKVGRKAPREILQRVLMVSPDGATEVLFEESAEINDDDDEDDDDSDDEIESVGNEDALEELPQRSHHRYRKYKIQEVIKRKQVLLIQVVKEERGNKGAALTTYLSLAGRYTVLMPNTARGGGISRKITNAADRKRLRKVAEELEIPEGMGLIIRTAGASRTKADVKRDFEYLLRLWENIRELTLKSTAPTLVYEEGNLIKKSIRDLYDKEIEEVLVSGNNAYHQAKDFMRMLMPSHAKNVHHYVESEPIFNRFQIENQLNAMFSPYVTLRSGGYIVINQTEALVSIDVNSGRATKEHSIEETALATNLEAAAEIARQLRLRDLAGLIVIDFIDMAERRNNRSVERKMKDSLKTDRARIQVGRISGFGLLEMSRQRLRAGVLEVNTSECPHCQGTGVIRSTESVALCVLRAIENKLQSSKPTDIIAVAPTEVALYLLNMKRDYLISIEKTFGVVVTIAASDKLHGANYSVDRDANAPARTAGGAYQSDDGDVVQMDWSHREDDDETGDGSEDEESKGRQKRRRRPRRGRRGERSAQSADNEELDSDSDETASALESADEDGDATDENGRRGRRGTRPRRRGRRGGRRNAASRDEEGNGATAEDNDSQTTDEAVERSGLSEEVVQSTGLSNAERRRAPESLFGRPTANENADFETGDVAGESQRQPSSEAERKSGKKAGGAGSRSPEPTGTKRTSRSKRKAEPSGEDDDASGSQNQNDDLVSEEFAAGGAGGSKRRGWWQRR